MDVGLRRKELMEAVRGTGSVTSSCVSAESQESGRGPGSQACPEYPRGRLPPFIEKRSGVEWQGGYRQPMAKVRLDHGSAAFKMARYRGVSCLDPAH